MMSAFDDLLQKYRKESRTEREKGKYFEDLTMLFLQTDPEWKDQFSTVWTYADWARKYPRYSGDDATDTGIDLVAQIAGDEKFCAIQCKFYEADRIIQKPDIDSFISSSAKNHFNRRLFVHTTHKDWGKNAAAMLKDQAIDTNCIDLAHFEKSAIDWATWLATSEIKLHPKKTLRPHQTTALAKVKQGFSKYNRGKLIMACGTGKTFTSLKIAEEQFGPDKRILYLVPSLALMSQTISEWSQDTQTPLRAFAVCSDTQVGITRREKEDIAQINIHHLAIPATTEAEKLAQQMNAHHHHKHMDGAPMTVVFSTYQSINVIAEAQANHNLAEFDLIICDEAHRTTGVTLSEEDESNFVKVHKQDIIRGKKRLYMTATPRIFGEAAKTKADEYDAALATMDDEEMFGPVFHAIKFGEAVEKDLLTDYKVLVLTVDEAMVSTAMQKRLSAGESELPLEDASKIIGCYRALTKQDLKDQDFTTDPDPMQRAVAFCRSIKTSKAVKKEFQRVLDGFRHHLMTQEGKDPATMLRCDTDHVDGTHRAKEREEKLRWLRGETDRSGLSESRPPTSNTTKPGLSEPESPASNPTKSNTTKPGKQEPDLPVLDRPVLDHPGPDSDLRPRPPRCRILSNARCLSEGVDVPSLDAILFMHPRKSQVDVVQSVGRVMRKAPGKNMGYVILPVVVPSDIGAAEALNNNQRYKIVWDVLNALRSHDERLDADINRISLGEPLQKFIEVVPVTDTLKPKNMAAKNTAHIGSTGGAEEATWEEDTTTTPRQYKFDYDEVTKAIMAKIVQKCGTRFYWADWATDIANIAQTHITRIKTVVAVEGSPEQRIFQNFLQEIRDDLNDGITEEEAIEMLAQHLITKPVFDTLFEGYSFTDQNPVSIALQKILHQLNTHNLAKEAETLNAFYASVKNRVAGITSARAKQDILRELYDKFFRNAFPKMTQRLGIVYTPVAAVDFIIHSLNDILRDEFGGKTLGSEGVNILDPFTGTGTFITRLLQSGLIAPDQLDHKYREEIHAVEIILLAYYIAAINIEQVWHEIRQEHQQQQDQQTRTADYQTFRHITLCDTFRMQEKDLLDSQLPENSANRRHLQNLKVQVIMGNPPYSAKQRSANDNAQNIKYPTLDQRLAQTFVANTQATNKNTLYDSYIRAIRWALDKIDHTAEGEGEDREEDKQKHKHKNKNKGQEQRGGVIGFITNGSWLEAKAMDGMRKSLYEECDKIYVLNLRGDIRKNMLSSGQAGEGGNIFGSDSMTGIAITVFVKKPKEEQKTAPKHAKDQTQKECEILYHDIGAHMTREEKLARLDQFKSINGIKNANGWQKLTPDKHHDWVNQREVDFDKYTQLGTKKDKSAKTIFANYSMGLKTQRDAWCYNASANQCSQNIKRMIAVYNQQRTRYHTKKETQGKSQPPLKLEEVIDNDPTKISWTRALKQSLEKNNPLTFDKNHITRASYRPFTHQMLYYDRNLNEMVYQMPQIFPLEGPRPFTPPRTRKRAYIYIQHKYT